jgi:dipeptidyl-peptidase-4
VRRRTVGDLSSKEQAAAVRAFWGGSRAFFNRSLANEGYVVLSFDNRGTPAPKGAAWRKIVYGRRESRP